MRKITVILDGDNTDVEPNIVIFEFADGAGEGSAVQEALFQLKLHADHVWGAYPIPKIKSRTPDTTYPSPL